MGNRSSTPSSSSTEGKGGDSSGSGLFLTPELQAKINQDFDSHVLQTEWGKYRISHLQRHQQRENTSSLREAETQQKMEAFQSHAKQVHNQLDEILMGAKSKLVDLEIEIDHDVNRLGKKFEGSLSDTRTTTEGKCLDVRAELSQCYHTLKDSGECQIFAQKLDKCVTEALAS